MSVSLPSQHLTLHNNKKIQQLVTTLPTRFH